MYYVNKKAICHYNTYLHKQGTPVLKSSVIARKFSAMAEVGEEVATHKENIVKVFCGKFKFTIDKSKNEILFVDIYDVEPEAFKYKVPLMGITLSERLKEAYERFGLNKLGNRLVIA